MEKLKKQYLTWNTSRCMKNQQLKKLMTWTAEMENWTSICAKSENAYMQ